MDQLECQIYPFGPIPPRAPLWLGFLYFDRIRIMATADPEDSIASYVKSRFRHYGSLDMALASEEGPVLSALQAQLGFLRYIRPLIAADVASLEPVSGATPADLFAAALAAWSELDERLGARSKTREEIRAMKGERQAVYGWSAAAGEIAAHFTEDADARLWLLNAGLVARPLIVGRRKQHPLLEWLLDLVEDVAAGLSHAIPLTSSRGSLARIAEARRQLGDLTNRDGRRHIEAGASELALAAIAREMPVIEFRNADHVLRTRAKLRPYLEPFRIEMRKLAAQMTSGPASPQRQADLERVIASSVQPALQELQASVKSWPQILSDSVLSSPSLISGGVALSAQLMGSSVVASPATVAMLAALGANLYKEWKANQKRKRSGLMFLLEARHCSGR